VHPVAAALTGLVAALHGAFMVLEMFLWRHRIGRRVFGLTPEFAERSATLAANQGLYNLFLAAGLTWGIVEARADVALFFLGCVVVAGVYGGLTVKRSIIMVQAMPAALAMAAVLWL
jgi:putative membrane protein